MKYIIHILIIVFLFMLASCEPENTPHPIFFIPKELKKRMVFKEGSYWIYKNTTTSDLDSVILVSDTTSLVTFPRNPGQHHDSFDLKFCQEYDMLCYSYFNKKYFLIRVFTSESNDEHYVCHAQKIAVTRNSESGFYTTIMAYLPYKSGRYRFEHSRVYLDSLKIEDQTYFEVAGYYDFHNDLENGDSTMHYTAKDFGLVRFQNLHTGDRWDLIRSSLIR